MNISFPTHVVTNTKINDIVKIYIFASHTFLNFYSHLSSQLTNFTFKNEVTKQFAVTNSFSYLLKQKLFSIVKNFFEIVLF